MAFTALAPERIDKLVAIDIAPVNYHVRRHDEIFAAINAVTDAGVTTRQQAAAVMREHINEEGVIQFLLKSFVDGKWRFNVPALWDQYPYIVGWETVPARNHLLSLSHGGNSPMLPNSIVTNCCNSSRRHARMSLPVPGTGYMQKSQKRFCAPSAVISLKRQTD